MNDLRPLAQLDLHELVEIVIALGEPQYRAEQIMDWFYTKRAGWFDEMTNLPAGLRGKLAETFATFTTVVTHTEQADDATVKLVVSLSDGHRIESVMIPVHKRRTGCISTQVGCPVGCVFCASGTRGCERNLEVAEIVEQVLHLVHALPAGEHLTHLVFMGIGEGLLNFDRLTQAIRILNAPWGLHIGARRMTVSTVGIPGTISKLAQFPLQVNLAISLHAPTDEIRRRLVPYANLLSVDGLMDEAEDFYQATGREVTFEYVLLAGINDSPELAEHLAKRAKPCHATVNLIPYNEVSGTGFSAPSAAMVTAFRGILRNRGVRVTARRTRGTGVDAACGQLRLDAVESEQP